METEIFPTFKKLYTRTAGNVSLALAAYNNKQEESCRRRNELASRFFSSISGAFKEVGSNFSLSFEKLAVREVSIKPIRNLAEKITAVLTGYYDGQIESGKRRVEFFEKYLNPVAEFKNYQDRQTESNKRRVELLSKHLNPYAESISYHNRQTELSKRRVELFSKFLTPISEIFNDFDSNFEKNISRLSSDLKSELGANLNTFGTRISSVSSSEETQKANLGSSIANDFKLAILAILILSSVASVTFTPSSPHYVRVNNYYNTVAIISQSLPVEVVQDQTVQPVVSEIKKLDPDTCKNIYYNKADNFNNSVVEYLISKGISHDFNYRSQLASELGISDYTGSSSQNWAFLNALFNKFGEFSGVACSF